MMQNDQVLHEVVCDICHSHYKIPYEKLKIGQNKVRCGKCGEIFFVIKEEPKEEDITPPPGLKNFINDNYQKDTTAKSDKIQGGHLDQEDRTNKPQKTPEEAYLESIKLTLEEDAAFLAKEKAQEARVSDQQKYSFFLNSSRPNPSILSKKSISQENFYQEQETHYEGPTSLEKAYAQAEKRRKRNLRIMAIFALFSAIILISVLMFSYTENYFNLHWKDLIINFFQTKK